MGKLAFLFPGQGAQHVGMARDFHDAFPASRSVYARACDVLGWDVAARCFEGPASELGRTAVSQPAIFVTSLAVLAAMEEKGFPQVKDATAAAGLSLGEYTALVFAGALEFECALQIVQKRGELMEAACEAQGGAMVSLIGLGEADAEAICRDAAQGQILCAANFNSPEQTVLSGQVEAVERAAVLAEQRGAKRAIRLQVAGAFHSPLMTPAAEQLQPVLREAPLRQPSRSVVPNVTAEPTQDPEVLRKALLEQVDHSIRWSQSMQRLIAEGYDRFVEVAPGKVLTGLLRRIDPSCRAVSVPNIGALEALADAAA